MLVRKPGLRTQLFEINTGNGVENALLIDIQYHPVKDNVVHVDFKRIDVKKPVSVIVPIETINADISKGVKLGGMLNFASRTVVLNGLIESIPSKIEIDLADMTMGDSVHGSDLKLPAGVELGLRQADLAFLTIVGKVKEEAAATDAAPAKK